MLRFHELTTPLDRAVLPFLYLYQTLFPIEEQEPCSRVIELLQQKAAGEPGNHRLVIAFDGETPVGILWFSHYEAGDGTRLGALWYIGVDSAMQSRGYGAELYAELCRQVFDEWQAGLLFYEVDMVANAPDEEQRRQAERRLRFYERQGAKLLAGITYRLHLNWQSPVPMHLLLQPHPTLTATTPEEAYQLAEVVYGTSVQRLPDQRLTLIAPTATFSGGEPPTP